MDKIVVKPVWFCERRAFATLDFLLGGGMNNQFSTETFRSSPILCHSPLIRHVMYFFSE
jgi:hypothetical protein